MKTFKNPFKNVIAGAGILLLCLAVFGTYFVTRNPSAYAAGNVSGVVTADPDFATKFGHVYDPNKVMVLAIPVGQQDPVAFTAINPANGAYTLNLSSAPEGTYFVAAIEVNGVQPAGSDPAGAQPSVVVGSSPVENKNLTINATLADLTGGGGGQFGVDKVKYCVDQGGTKVTVAFLSAVDPTTASDASKYSLMDGLIPVSINSVTLLPPDDKGKITGVTIGHSGKNPVGYTLNANNVKNAALDNTMPPYTGAVTLAACGNFPFYVKDINASSSTPSPTPIAVTFSGAVDQATATNKDNYSLVDSSTGNPVSISSVSMAQGKTDMIGITHGFGGNVSSLKVNINGVKSLDLNNTITSYSNAMPRLLAPPPPSSIQQAVYIASNSTFGNASSVSITFNNAMSNANNSNGIGNCSTVPTDCFLSGITVVSGFANGITNQNILYSFLKSGDSKNLTIVFNQPNVIPLEGLSSARLTVNGIGGAVNLTTANGVSLPPPPATTISGTPVFTAVDSNFSNNSSILITFNNDVTGANNSNGINGCTGVPGTCFSNAGLVINSGFVNGISAQNVLYMFVPSNNTKQLRIVFNQPNVIENTSEARAAARLTLNSVGGFTNLQTTGGVALPPPPSQAISGATTYTPVDSNYSNNSTILVTFINDVTSADNSNGVGTCDGFLGGPGTCFNTGITITSGFANGITTQNVLYAFVPQNNTKQLRIVFNQPNVIENTSEARAAARLTLNSVGGFTNLQTTGGVS
ncbi:MAG: hypothetical protein V1908_01275, partial [Candidatus Peregrinibacteria bacterium]